MIWHRPLFFLLHLEGVKIITDAIDKENVCDQLPEGCFTGGAAISDVTSLLNGTAQTA